MDKMRLGRGRSKARRLRLLGIGLGIAYLVLLQPAGGLVTRAPLAWAQQDEFAYNGEMDKGRDFMRRRQYEEALKSFKRANEMRDKKSPDCFLAMANAYQGLEAYKNVAESCDKVIELAPNDIGLQLQAYNLKGVAFQSQAESRDQKKLKDAEATFRQGLAVDANLMPVLHFNLGYTLMQQGRDQEGIAELKRYLELQPKGTDAAQAQKLIGNPRRARETFAPEFSVTTSDGEYLSLEDMRGKVILLDFWGTWCPPCVASVPSLRGLYKRFEKEPSFVMIGISSDREAEPWRTFIAKNQMVWPQFWDRDHRVQRAFEIRAFPTYILIDHEGIVRFRTTGSGWEHNANLEDAIRKQVKLVSKTPG
jgi:peroxiredoxin/Tfp pilus assembly protein PilF